MDNEKHNVEVSRTKTRCTIWRRRTILERYLFLVCLAMFIALLVTIVFIFHEKHVHKRRLPTICLSPKCTQEAERTINYMDTSVDPCEDFYNFTCGSYLKAPFSLSYDDRAFNKEAYDSMERLTKELLETINEEEGPEFLKKVKRYYQSCLNSSNDAVELMEQILGKTMLEKWPILEGEESYMNSIEKTFAITAIYGHANPFLSIMRTNFTSGQIYFYSGEMLVPEEILLNKTDKKLVSKKKMYIEVLEYTLFKLKPSKEDLQDIVEEIIEFETELANITYNNRMILDYNRTDTTLKEFSSNCTGIKWSFVIRNIYDHYGYFDDFSEDIPVIYWEKEYIQNLCQLLNESREKTIYNYLVWSLLLQKLSIVHTFYRNNMLEIKDDIYSTLDRWKICVSDIIYSDFEPGVSYLVLHRLQPEKTKEEVEGYVEEIREEMDRMFLENTWIGSTAKDIARKKLANIGAAIAYSTDSLDVDMIEKHFAQFNVTDSYMENQLMTLERAIQRGLFNDSFNFEDNVNITQPIWTSGYYTGKLFELSLGFLSPPLFQVGMPKYYNYGTIGVVIGHEFMHGFDNLDYKQSSSYEWPEETVKQFKEKRNCYVDQYSKFPLEYVGSKMNSTKTNREDLSDNVAIGQAFNAYEKYLQKNGPEQKLPGLDYTNQQMFFIRYGQSWCGPPKSYAGRSIDIFHSPGRYRITGSLQNFPRFSEVFNCPTNSPMNPKHKCQMY